MERWFAWIMGDFTVRAGPLISGAGGEADVPTLRIARQQSKIAARPANVHGGGVPFEMDALTSGGLRNWACGCRTTRAVMAASTARKPLL